MKKSKNLNSLFACYGILIIVWFLAGCREKGPEIQSIEPRIGRMGDVLTIRGKGFGDERNESFITIAGTSPTSSSYISWNDGEVLVRIPEFGEAGLVYVHRGRKKSNPSLFANQVTLPTPIEGTQTENTPRISSIEPSSGAIGSLITIQGNNFGSSLESSGVFFTWDAESPTGGIHGLDFLDFIEAFESEYGYDLWSEREIRVRIPDGASSGSLEVRTPRGNSPPVYFEISGKPGTKIFRDKRSYTISYSVDFSIDKASIPNALYIWMPQPTLSASQRNVRLLSRSTDPFVENYRGTSLFQFVDAHPKTGINLTVSYVVDVYAVETSIKSQTPVRLNSPSPLGTILPSPLVPSNDPVVKAKSAEIIGNERLPYPNAQKIYDWLVSTIQIADVSQTSNTPQIVNTPLSGSVFEALEENKADSFSASLLFCALARAAGIPAQPVAGVIVNREGIAFTHCWAEFWLDGFGWIPLDPALGAGAQPPNFNLWEDHAKYYFGNLDSQRIAFSRGERFLSQMTPWGQIAERGREYSLQNIWEEAAEGLETYSSLWSDVTITGIY